MSTIKLAIICSTFLISVFLFTGGFYKVETIQLGLLHKTNIITGKTFLCNFETGCNPFPEYKEVEPESIISLFRDRYPQYNDLSNEKLMNGLYRKYTEKFGIKISESEFNKILQSREST